MYVTPPVYIAIYSKTLLSFPISRTKSPSKLCNPPVEYPKSCLNISGKPPCSDRESSAESPRQLSDRFLDHCHESRYFTGSDG